MSLVPTGDVDNVGIGDLVTFDIIMDFKPDAVLGGGFDIAYSSSALQFASFFRDPAIGEADFSRDPDIFADLLESWAVGDFLLLPKRATLGSVSFEVLAGIGPDTVVAVTATSGIGGPWVSGTDFLTVLSPTYNQVLVSYDTDGDGTPNADDDDDDNDGVDDVDEGIAGTNPLDPDSDDDGIGDALDNDPLIASNDCSGADVHDFFEMVIEPLTCAATTSITVKSIAEVLADGDLHVIAPFVSFESGFSVIGLLTVTSADPCPLCSP